MVIKQTEDFTRFCAKELLEGEIDICWPHLSIYNMHCVKKKKSKHMKMQKPTCSPKVWAKCNFRFAI